MGGYQSDIGGSGGIPIEGRSIYVSVFGTDATGETGNPNKPFKTVVAAYAHASTLTPLLSDPVFIKLQQGTFNEDVTLTTSYIYIFTVQTGTLLYDPSHPGLSATFTTGSSPVEGVQAKGGWDSLEDFDDYTGVTFTIGSEVWAAVLVYAGVPFTYPIGSGDPGFRWDSLIDNFNTNNTQGLLMHYNLGNLCVDTGGYNFSLDGLTVTTTGAENPDFASKNGIVCAISDPNLIAGSEISPTSGGTNPVAFIPGSGTPTFERGTIIDGTIIIQTGVITVLEGFDCQNIALEGVVTGCSFKNLNVYAELVAISPDTNSWVDVHAAGFFTDQETQGEYLFCSGDSHAFSGRSTIRGRYTSCASGDFGFGLNSINAIVIECVGNDYCYGRPEIGSQHRSTYIRCIGNDQCYAAENNIISVLDSCVGNNKCYGYISNFLAIQIPNGGNSISFNQVSWLNCIAHDDGFIRNAGGGTLSTITIAGSILMKNCRLRRNGMIHASGDAQIIKTSTFEAILDGCVITSSGTGGFITSNALVGSVVNITNISIINCSKGLGTVYLSNFGDGDFILSNVTVQGCVGQDIFRQQDTGGTTSFTDIIFRNTIASQKFFEVTQNHPNLSFTRVLIQNCNAKEFTGVLNEVVLVANEQVVFDNITQKDTTKALFAKSPFEFILRNTEFEITGGNPPLTIADGAEIRGCRIKSDTAVDSISSNVAINAKISYTAHNKLISANITNDIETTGTSFNNFDPNI